MKRRRLATLFAVLLFAMFSTTALAVNVEDEDTDTKMVDAKVVEVGEGRIAVVARTGVEHVIAIDGKDTKVLIDDRAVSLKDLREGDIVTIVLDEKNPLKFAKNIELRMDNQLVARARP